MWATLALATVLNTLPAQTGELALKNPRATYGILGQKRPNAEFLQGDVFVLSYDIDNLTVKDDGRVLYSMGMEVLNKEGKSQFKNEPRDLEVTNALGGNRLPAFALVEIGLDTPAGEYTVKITVTDRANKKTATMTEAFKVLPPDFGIVRLHLSYQNGEAAPPLGVPGQRFLLNFAVVGFSLDPAKKQPNVGVELRILDEKGQPTLKQPFTGEIKEVAEANKKVIPLNFILDPDRSGKFRLELTATDKNTKKTVKQTLDFTVAEPK
jgi:hypothetical protein